MNFKSFAVAAAAAALSVSSFAAVKVDGTPGESELFFIASNSAGTYFQDLGISTDAFASQMTLTGSFTQSVLGAQWTKFLGLGGTGTTWAVIAVNPVGDGFNPGEFTSFATLGPGEVAGSIQNSQLQEGSGGLANSAGETANALNNNGGGRPANHAWADAVGGAGFVPQGTIDFGGFLNTRNAIGTASQMYVMSLSGDVSDAPVTTTLFVDPSLRVNFDGNNVFAVSTPIPEPGTYALLGAGLAAVSFVARRRSANNKR